MKIKCRSCGLEIQDCNEGMLKTHYEIHPHESLREYAKQEFKIHEKIEEFDKQGEEDFKHAYPSPCTDTQIDLLKSLLGSDEK